MNMNTIVRLSGLGVAALMLIAPAEAFETDKWTKKKTRENDWCDGQREFKGTDGVCDTYWGNEIDYAQGAIDVAAACGFCFFAGGLVGCTGCASGQAAEWLHETVKGTVAGGGRILDEMQDDVIDLFTIWIESVWDDVLSGRSFTHTAQGWRIKMRGGGETYCSCNCVGSASTCGEYRSPFDWCHHEICGKSQPYIQMRVDRDPDAHSIYVKNSCREDIKVAVRYLDPSTETWTSKCWYSIESGAGVYLATGGSRIRTLNGVKYMYAESDTGSLVWQGTGSAANVRACGGRQLPMFRKDYVDGDGDLYTNFVCNSRRNLQSTDDWEVAANTTHADSPITYLRVGGLSADEGALEQLSELPKKEVAFKQEHFGIVNPKCDAD